MNNPKIGGIFIKATLILLFLLPLLTGCGGGATAVDRMKDYLNDPAYPQDFWETATPEDVGMDSGKLIQGSNISPGANSILVVRHGKLVFERYSLGQQGPPTSSGPVAPNHQILPDEPQILYSATKSITSALIGIALNEGCIKNLQDPVLPYFPDITPQNMSTRKTHITVEDVLTMQSGLEWTESDPDCDGLYGTYDSVQYILDKPMVSEPGTVWNYCTGNSTILTSMIYRTTGKTPDAYAREKLFGPLGITNFHWDADGKGVNFGGSRLYLTSRDMAKFGYLYLKRGLWGGIQVIPASWVDTSTVKHTSAGAGADYGYHWWMWSGSYSGYMAGGALGQRIFVCPEKDLVLVVTAFIYPNSTADQVMYQITQNVLAAVKD